MADDTKRPRDSDQIRSEFERWKDTIERGMAMTETDPGPLDDQGRARLAARMDLVHHLGPMLHWYFDVELLFAEIDRLNERFEVMRNLAEQSRWREIADMIKEGLQLDLQPGIIGREDKLNEVLTEHLHRAALKLGDYTPVREMYRGRWFEIRMDDGSVMKVTVVLDRIESE